MSRSFRILLTLSLLCIIGAAAYTSYKVFFSSPSRSIPPLKGGSVIEAVQTLERMGIKARIEEEDSTLPRGTVSLISCVMLPTVKWYVSMMVRALLTDLPTTLGISPFTMPLQRTIFP